MTQQLLSRELAGDDGSGDARDWEAYNNEFKGVADRVIAEYVADTEIARLPAVVHVGDFAIQATAEQGLYRQQVYQGPEYFHG